MKSDLLKYRERIDEIDQAFVRLLEERMAVSEAIAGIKQREGLAVYDPAREEEKIGVVTGLAHTDFNRQAVRELFTQLMAVSRKKQYQLIRKSGTDQSGFRLVDRLPHTGVNVAFQGIEGAYSHAALLKYFGEKIARCHVKTWEDAMEAVGEGMADYAVLPIENSTAGIVAGIYDLLMNFRLYIVGEQLLPVDHVLLGCPDASLEDILTVISHPQGLAQCHRYLMRHPEWGVMEAENTALAAREVSERGQRGLAAIASREAGETYGLKILDEAICQNQGNETRFIVVSAAPMYTKAASTVSICFELPHSAGSLYHMLAHIIYNGLNMTRIESRPIPGKNWQYRFFVDFDGNLSDHAVQCALEGIRNEADLLVILGNY